jgi:hypothetical protein
VTEVATSRAGGIPHAIPVLKKRALEHAIPAIREHITFSHCSSGLPVSNFSAEID